MLRFVKTALLGIFVITVQGALPVPIVAQTLTVRLLNAKSGKVIRNKHVTLIWCPDCFLKSDVAIGKDGLGKVEIPNGAKTFAMMGGPRTGSEPYRIAFVNCNQPAKAQFQISEAIANGVVPENACGKQTFPPRPGEVTFWALPKSWWMLDFQ